MRGNTLRRIGLHLFGGFFHEYHYPALWRTLSVVLTFPLKGDAVLERHRRFRYRGWPRLKPNVLERHGVLLQS